MNRVILDTNVLASGLRSSRGASFVVLRLVYERRLRPLLTVPLLFEYEDVLHRPEHMAHHGMSSAGVDEFLMEWTALSEAVEVHFRWRPQLADPKDELVLEAAINGAADALVTYNVRDFLDASSSFGLRVLRPAELIVGMRT
jgi:putative PIN family toxin of toxin-antitoxin system